MRMNGMRWLVAVVCLAQAGFAAAADSASCLAADAVREHVASRWGKICDVADKASELRDELPNLPESSIWFWKNDQRGQQRAIQKHLQRARQLLLSTNSQELLQKISKLEEKLDEIRRETDGWRNKMIISPDKREEYQKKIDKLESQKAELDASRAEMRGEILAELQGMGLKIDEKTADCFLSNVCSDTIIDDTIIAKNIAAVVENLRQLMSTSDVKTAKRYFGMYIVLVDVQLECFREYLEKSDEEWSPGVNSIIAEAEETMNEALRNAENTSYTPEQRAIFRNNAAMNKRTIQAARAYTSMLGSQAMVVKRKMEAAQRIRNVAMNSYNTVRLAGDFLSLIQSNGRTFDAILEMDIPAVFTYDDSGLQQEFLQITRRLQEKE